MAIVSKTKKLCFIHIYKTGGTTIRIMLTKDLKKIGINDFNIVGNEHGTMKQCLDLNPEIKDYFKFTYVRNPYDWLLSLYYYIRMSEKHPDYQIIKDLSFLQFINWIEEVGMKREDNGSNIVYRTQSDFVFHRNKLMVDYVYKFEELCDDSSLSNLRGVFAKIDLAQPDDIPVLNKSERPLVWLNQYTAVEFKLVNRIFEKDFKNFKYTQLW